MPEVEDERARYAIRVRGRLGPLFLATLPHRTTQRYEDRTTLLARVADDDLVDVLRRVAELGGDVESLRRLDEPGRADQPGPADERERADQPQPADQLRRLDGPRR